MALPLTAVAVLEVTPFEVGLLAAASYVAWIVIGLPAGVIVQTASPADLLSRVMATVRFATWAPIPIGALTAGALAATVGVRPALWLTATCAAVPLIALLASPIRQLRDLDEIDRSQAVGTVDGSPATARSSRGTSSSST